MFKQASCALVRSLLVFDHTSSPAMAPMKAMKAMKGSKAVVRAMPKTVIAAALAELKRSPMVQALAQHKPEVKQIMNDPKKLQEEMALVQRNLAALQKAEQAMRNPYKRQQVMRWADV